MATPDYTADAAQNSTTSADATLRETWAYAADDVLIHALPIFHTHGLFVATYPYGRGRRAAGAN